MKIIYCVDYLKKLNCIFADFIAIESWSVLERLKFKNSRIIKKVLILPLL